jgi:predicted ATPase/DNA-binding winged helix-turn-helix (wHTH) protein
MSTTLSWHFGPFRLDLATASLWRGDQLLSLPPKPLAVLVYLVAHAGHVVTKAALLEAVWPDAVVTEGVLKTYLGQIRQAMGERAKTPRYIATVHRLGYRFIAPVTVVERLQAADIALSPRPVAFAKQRQGPEPVSHAPGLMVGREAELVQLHQWWTRALKGERQVVVVTGEAGIGKTTIVDTFAAQVVGMEPIWIGRGQCIEQYGTGEAYLPLLEALGRLCRGADGDRLFDLLHQYAPSWLLQLPALVSTPEFDALQRRVSGTTRERMLRELVEVVEVLTAERPLLLVLEDLHWSDSATIEWLAYVARRPDWARLLVLGTYRPVDAIVRAHPVRPMLQELQRHGRGVELALSSLPEAGVAAYLARRFGEGALPDELARVLRQRTNGNPLFLVMIVDELVRQGILREGAAGWEVAAGLETVARGAPESLRHLVEQQLQQVSPEDRGLLEVASIAGREFSAAAVAAVVNQDTEDIEARLAVLAQHGQFIRSGGLVEWPDETVAAGYGFLHDLYREILYDQVPPSRKGRWHLEIGARKETGYGARAREIAAELAGHFVQGRDPGRAVQYLYDAGENALQRSAHQEAVTHLTQGIALLAQWPETPQRAQQELHMQTALGPALMATKGFGHPEVEHTYTRARALCQQVGNAPQLFPVLSGLWRFANGRAQHQQAWELGEHLLTVAQQSGDPALLLQAHHALWTTASNTGTFPTAYRHVEHGLALYSLQQHHAQTALYGGHDPGVCGRSYASQLVWLLGYPDQAAQWNEAALTLAQELAHPFTLGHTLLNVAAFHKLRRDDQRVYEWAQATLTLGRAQESQYLVAQSTVLLGWALAVQGQSTEGITQIHQGLAAWQAIGTPHLRAWMLALLAEAYGQVGCVEEGLAALAEALTIVDTTGGRKEEAELYRLKGELLWQAGTRPEEAEACLHQALDIACRHQAKSWELRAAMSLSRFWKSQGKRVEAYQLLAEVYGWFTEGFDTADLQEAKALMEELS